jgi:hypothetical protein
LATFSLQKLLFGLIPWRNLLRFGEQTLMQKRWFGNRWFSGVVKKGRGVIRSLAHVIALLTVILCAGCSAPPEAEISGPRKSLRAINTAYIRATDKLDRGPANLKELLPYVKQQGDPDQLLRSTDDNEAFVIIWGVDYRKYAAEKKKAPVIAYEKTGQGGKRYVLRGRAVLHMTDEEFRQAPFPPGHKPAT